MLKLIALIFTLFSSTSVLAITADEFLFESVRRCRADLAAEALSAGANVNHRELITGDTPLMAAYGSGCTNSGIYHTLIKAGADLNAQNALGHTALHFAVDSATSAGCNPDYAGILLAAKANPNLADQNGETPIFRALASYKRGCATRQVIAGLIQQGKADTNVVNKAGFGVLEFALDKIGYNDGAEILIDLVHAKARPTDRILYKLLAAFSKHGLDFHRMVFVLEAILTKSVALTGFKDSHGRNVLHLAAQLPEYEDAYKYALSPSLMGFFPLLNEQDQDGNTPLHLYLIALQKVMPRGKAQADVVRAYVAAKANVNLRNAKGQTTLRLAKGLGYYEIIWILEQANGIE